jgi:hypothetical protein
MNEHRPVLNSERVGTVARVIHGAIVGGLAVAFAVFLYLQSRASLEFPDRASRMLRLIGYGILASAVLASLVVRGRIEPPSSGDAVNEWWTVNLEKAVVCWALAEGGGLAALILGWVIGDTTLLALGTAVGLALLFVTRPGRLQTRR